MAEGEESSMTVFFWKSFEKVRDTGWLSNLWKYFHLAIFNLFGFACHTFAFFSTNENDFSSLPQPEGA